MIECGHVSLDRFEKLLLANVYTLGVEVVTQELGKTCNAYAGGDSRPLPEHRVHLRFAETIRQ